MVVLQDTIANMQKAIIARCMKDPAFKAQFLANPRGTVESAFKVALPAHIQIEVKQGAPNTVTVMMPHEVAAGAGGELSDADLEAVAGGAKSGDDMATWGATHPLTLRMSNVGAPSGPVGDHVMSVSAPSSGIVAGDEICF